jgi:hypothetical protein
MIEEPGKARAMVIAVVVWLVTAVLSVVSLLAAREMALRTLARFGLPELVPVANWLVVVFMAFFGIAVIIGGFEFHYRRAGTEESWRMFSYTLSVEAAIILQGVFI